MSAETSGAVNDALLGSSAPDSAVAASSADARAGDQDAPPSDPSPSDIAAAAQAGLGASPAITIQSAPAGGAAPAPRTASETAANLSAQIAQNAGGQTTRFDVQLDPLGLGRVNVSIEIDAKGAMSAALSFEKPEAASLLRAHASDLQQSLAQVGFNLSDAALSFSTAAQDGRGLASQAPSLGTGAEGGGQQSQNGQAQNAGRAFGAAGLAADQTDQIATAARTFTARGLDIRI